MTAKPFDPTLKALVETEPGSWPGFFHQPTGPTRVIDADIATVSGAADKVLLVEATTPYLLHLEFVAGHDAADLPWKLHVRHGLLEDRHRMHVRSSVVLLRPEANSPQLTGTYERRFPDEEPYLVFRYQVVRVWRLPPEPLLMGSLALIPLALISAVTEVDLPGIIQRIGQRLSGRRQRRLAERVWAASFILLGLRYSSALAAQLFRGVLTMKESSTYQMILEEGRAEGRTEGAVSEARKLLRRAGDGFFVHPDDRTAAAIDQIDDLARLESLFDRLRSATNWQELLGPTAPAPGAGADVPSRGGNYRFPLFSRRVTPLRRLMRCRNLEGRRPSAKLQKIGLQSRLFDGQSVSLSRMRRRPASAAGDQSGAEGQVPQVREGLRARPEEGRRR